jgi:hypothetical protein
MDLHLEADSGIVRKACNKKRILQSKLLYASQSNAENLTVRQISHADTGLKKSEKHS